MKYRNVLLFALFALLITGCDFGPAKPDGFPKNLQPCELTITQDGVPLQGAIVQLFSSDSEQKDWSVGGRSNAAGLVVPYTYGKWKGVPQGTLKVCVKKEITEEVNGKEVIFSLVENKFGDPQMTPFDIEVKRKTVQTFDVSPAIKKKVPK